ncbi:MAG: ABC transporter permease [Rubripirellula sp.]
MVFVLPVLFFTVFAIVFSAGGEAGAGRLDVLVVDMDQSEVSKRLIQALGTEPTIKLSKLSPMESKDPPREVATQRVSDGEFSVAIVLPSGLQSSLSEQATPLAPEIVFDPTDIPARWIVAGSLQDAARRSFPESFVLKQLAQLKKLEFPPQVRSHLQAAWDTAQAEIPIIATAAPETSPAIELWEIRSSSPEKLANNPAAYYAAGTAVMFLLFSMAGAGGSLLEEREAGTLERIFNSGVSVAGLLYAKWLFFAGIAFVQVATMFAWGALCFGIQIGSPARLIGLIAMTAVTAAGAAAFGILLATVCRTRAQLSSISTILILLMSALGGSMVPRFAMPPIMETVGLLTFNGWALDGYLKVLWYSSSESSALTVLTSLVPQIAVLIIFSTCCLLLAARLGKSWEIE